MRSGRGIVDDRHPLGMTIASSYRVWKDTDLLIGFGTRLDTPTARWGKVPEGVKIARIDIDPAEMRRLKVDIGIVADAADAAGALLPMVARKNNSERTSAIARAKAEVAAAIQKLQPQMSFLDVIREVLPENGILCDEMTQVGYVSWFGFPVHSPRSLITSGFSGTLGAGFPMALGVKVAQPDRPVVAVSGDGGFLFGGAELATAALHGINLVTVVFNNSSYGNVLRDQRRLFDGRDSGATLAQPRFRCLRAQLRRAGVARAGCEGVEGRADRSARRQFAGADRGDHRHHQGTGAVGVPLADAGLTMDFATARERFVSGASTPRDCLEDCLARIDAREPVVRAFVCTNFEGARRAADASAERYRAGKPLSSIDGMPVAIKDIIETVDMPTEFGSPIFKDWRGGRDAACVFALRQAGAVIVGKAVTTEFAGARPGPTTNPLDASRTPGGSSSGSAAAVAAGMVPVALGTQVGGSVLRPASFCGVIGFKPTYGSLNRGNLSDNYSQNCIGTLSATLQDGWAVCHEIAERVGGDPGFPPFAGGATPAAARRPDVLAVLETAGWGVAQAEAKEALHMFLRTLSDDGVQLIDRRSSKRVAALEDAIAEVGVISEGIAAWECALALCRAGDAFAGAAQRVGAQDARARRHSNAGRIPGAPAPARRHA